MSKFTDRHKRKTLSALLLLLLRGKAKYVAVMLVVMAVSTPFVVSGDTLSRFLEMPGVSAFLRTVGLGSLVSSLNPNYSSDMVKSALERAAADAQNYSVWQRFLNGLAGAVGGAGGAGDPNGTGTVGMVKAGDDFYDSKNGKGKNGKGGDDVKGVMNDEERNREGDPDAMNFEDMLAGGPGGYGMGADGMGGMKDMGFGSGGGGGYLGGGSYGSNYGPYMNKGYLGGGGAGSGGSAAANHGLASTSIPDLKTRSMKKTGQMGRMSGFSWRNMGYRTKGTNMNARINSNRRALFQAAETFTMTASAAKSNAALEHQASYVGSTYDGNAVGADLVTIPGTPTTLPDTGFVDDLMTSADDWSQLARDCADAQEVQGTNISYHEKQIDTIAQTLGNPPKCCNHGAVDRWNGKVEQMRYHCNEVNANEVILSQKCQAASQQQDCGSTYDKMRIKKCSKWKCWFGIILAVLMMIIGAILCITGFGTIIGVALLVAGAALLIGQLVGGTLGAILGAVGMLVAAIFTGGAAALAIGVAYWAATEAVKAGGADDGSNAVNND